MDGLDWIGLDWIGWDWMGWDAVDGSLGGMKYRASYGGNKQWFISVIVAEASRKPKGACCARLLEN